MDVKTKTLKKILANGKSNYIDNDTKNVFFTEKSLGNLEKDETVQCFKKLKIKVVDFDETEEKLRYNKSRSRKSCDALKFVTTAKKGEIHFIELKSIENLKKDTSIKTREDIRNKIKNFQLYKKFRDSILILSEVVEHKNMNLTTNDIENYYETPKQPILLVDIKRNSIDELVFVLESLSTEDAIIKNEIYSELGKTGKNDTHNLLDAKLAYCDDFEEQYSENNSI